jgi:hypothetical protein
MCIVKAWQHISADIIVQGFKKCCFSNAEDGTDDDDTLWNGSEEGRDVRSECEEDDGA